MDDMESEELLTTLANDQTHFLYDEMGYYVLKNGDGSIIKTLNNNGNEVDAWFSYDYIRGFICQHYIEQDTDDLRIYRISAAGLRAARSP